MPRDTTTTATAARPTAATLAYCGDQRRQLFALLESAGKARRRGLHPFERAGLPGLRRALRGLTNQAGKVLP